MLTSKVLKSKLVYKGQKSSSTNDILLTEPIPPCHFSRKMLLATPLYSHTKLHLQHSGVDTRAEFYESQYCRHTALQLQETTDNPDLRLSQGAFFSSVLFCRKVRCTEEKRQKIFHLLVHCPSSCNS